MVKSVNGTYSPDLRDYRSWEHQIWYADFCIVYTGIHFFIIKILLIIPELYVFLYLQVAYFTSYKNYITPSRPKSTYNPHLPPWQIS